MAGGAASNGGEMEETLAGKAVTYMTASAW